MIALTSLIVLILPFLGFAVSPLYGEEFLVFYEVVIAAITSAVLFAALVVHKGVHCGKFAVLGCSMMAVSLAEAICGVGFLRNNIGERGQSSAEMLYLIFWMGLILVMRWHYGPVNPRRSQYVWAALGLIFGVSYWVQCHFILPTLQLGAANWFGSGYMHLWIILKSTALVLSIAYSARALDGLDLVFLHSVVGLFCVGLSAAHQAVATGFGIMRWFEAAWAAFLGAILVVLVASLIKGKPIFSRQSPLSPWYSLRSAIGVSVFLANAAVIAGVAFLDMITIGHAVSVALLLLLMFVAWTVANLFAFRISSEMGQALQYAPINPDDAGSDAKWAMLEKMAQADNGLLSEFSSLLDRYVVLSAKMGQLAHNSAEAESEAEMGRLATQVAHDIRSPLAALKIILGSASELPAESRDIVNQATQRVHDIADNLLAQTREKRATSHQAQPILVGTLLEQIVAEKRLALQSSTVSISCEFETASQFAFVKMPRFKLGSTISNIINNAIEAIVNVGTVRVRLQIQPGLLLCSIIDDGVGIPPKILAQLGQKGGTFGKANGNGFGLYGAKMAVQEIGGDLEISSVAGLGTTVTLKLPTCSPPEWFAQGFNLKSISQIAIVDDDTNAHRVWMERLRPMLQVGLKVKSIATPAEFTTWMNKGETDANTRFLIDQKYEGSAVTGLDLIASFGLADRSLLVTNHAETPEVTGRCQQLGVQTIPKPLAATLPFRYVATRVYNSKQGNPR